MSLLNISSVYHCSSLKIGPQIPLNSSLQKVEPDSTPHPAPSTHRMWQTGSRCNKAHSFSLLSLGSLPLGMPAAMWPGHSGNPVQRPTRWGAESHCKRPARSRVLCQQPFVSRHMNESYMTQTLLPLPSPGNLAPRTSWPSPARTAQLSHPPEFLT